MNLLFPRPEEPEEEPTKEDTSKPSGLRASFSKLFSRRSMDKDNDSNKKMNEKENDDMKNKSNESKKEKGKDRTIKKGKEQVKEKDKDTDSEVSEEDAMVTRLKRPKKQRTVMLHEYGPPLYQHLSPASWEACLLARMAIENSIELLDLDIKFYHDNKADADEGDANEKEGEEGTTVAENDQKDKTSVVGEPPSRLSSRLGKAKPPIQRTFSNNEGFALTQISSSGQHYDVTVPVLTLPKRVNDSFEEKLLDNGGRTSSNASDGGGASGGYRETDSSRMKSERLEARFRKK